jgi:photosystem II stability/assembly factor-like uncharacterized protein
MRKIIVLLLSLTLLLLSNLGAWAENKGGQWKMVLQSEVKGAVNLAGFANEQNGITIGYGGEIHFSHDGGKTWPRAINNSWCRFGLEILDEKTAWHCGNKGHIRLSTDGGESWDPVADFGQMEPDQCRFLSFADAKTGWAAAPFYIAATNDGAASWKEFDLPEASKNLAAIHLLTANDGYLLDVSGKLFITKDGGKTWSQQTVPLKGLQLQTLKCPTAAMRFTDAKNGVVVVSAKGSVISFTTVDGGKTWSQSLVTDKLFGFLFLSRDGKLLTITGKLGNLSDKEGALISVFKLQ